MNSIITITAQEQDHAALFINPPIHQSIDPSGCARPVAPAGTHLSITPSRKAFCPNFHVFHHVLQPQDTAFQQLKKYKPKKCDFCSFGEKTPFNPTEPYGTPATLNSQTYPRWDILSHFILGTFALHPGQNRNKPASSAEKMSQILISVHGSPPKSTQVHGTRIQTPRIPPARRFLSVRRISAGWLPCDRANLLAFDH